MKIFVSWSGEETRGTAEKMRLWLKSMFQRNVDVFVSSKDIEKGDRWAERLAAVLEEYNFGVVVLNAENKDRPWINFEAGALSKSVTKARLISFLCGLRPGDLIESPLGQFQNVEANKEGLLELAGVVNAKLETPLAEAEIRDAFDVWWEKRGKDVCEYSEPTAKSARRTSEQVSLRDVLARIDRLESRIIDLVGFSEIKNVDPLTQLLFKDKVILDENQYLNYLNQERPKRSFLGLVRSDVAREYQKQLDAQKGKSDDNRSDARPSSDTENDKPR